MPRERIEVRKRLDIRHKLDPEQAAVFVQFPNVLFRVRRAQIPEIGLVLNDERIFHIQTEAVIARDCEIADEFAQSLRFRNRVARHVEHITQIAEGRIKTQRALPFPVGNRFERVKNLHPLLRADPKPAVLARNREFAATFFRRNGNAVGRQLEPELSRKLPRGAQKLFFRSKTNFHISPKSATAP